MTAIDSPNTLIRSQTFPVNGLVALTTRDETMTWTTPFPDDTYIVNVEQDEGSDSQMDAVTILGVKSKTATQVTFRIRNSSGSQFGTEAMLIGVWGGQS